jgi:uncharacterized protein YdaU (DUF1376 family)
MRQTSKEQYVGQTFNKLTILSLDYKEHFYKEKIIKWYYFNCKCTCGNTKSILTNSVLKGDTKSCGCDAMDSYKRSMQEYYNSTTVISADTTLFNIYRLRAKHRKQDFDLTKEEFFKIINSNCHYCNTSPILLRFNDRKTEKSLLNGVDRVDSLLGYTTENTVPCCTTCNRMKLDHTTSDFLNHIQKITKFQNEKINININDTIIL